MKLEVSLKEQRIQQADQHNKLEGIENNLSFKDKEYEDLRIRYQDIEQKYLDLKLQNNKFQTEHKDYQNRIKLQSEEDFQISDQNLLLKQRVSESQDSLFEL